MVVPSPRSTAISRAVDAFEVVATLGSASPTDISERAGIAKSSASDLIATLVSEGLLRRDSEGDCSLAAGIVEIAAGSVPNYHLTDDFVSLAGRVPDLQDCTVSLEVLSAGHVICLDVRLGRDPLACTPRAGLTTRISESGPGKAILRSLTEEQLSEHAERFRGQDGLEAADIPQLMALHRREREAASLRSADLTVSEVVPSGDIDIAHPVVHSRGAVACAAVTARLSERSTASERRRIERGVRTLAELLPA